MSTRGPGLSKCAVSFISASAILAAACSAPLKFDGGASDEAGPVPGTVRLALSVHAEGYEHLESSRLQRRVQFANHSAILDEFQGALDGTGAAITFEGELPYLVAEVEYAEDVEAGLETHVSTTAADRVAAGHFFSAHANLHDHATECAVGSADCASGVEHLETLRSFLEELGFSDSTYMSGVCAEADWISMMQAAGFSVASGLVGWCARAIPEAALISLGEDYAAILDCTGPASCHEQIPFEDEDRLRTWKSSDITNWLTDDPGGAVTMVPSMGDLRCLAESAAGAEETSDCDFTAEDNEAYFDLLDSAVEAASDGDDRVLVLTLSIGTPFDDAGLELLSEWASRLKSDYVDSGAAGWHAAWDVAGSL